MMFSSNVKYASHSIKNVICKYM